MAERTDGNGARRLFAVIEFFTALSLLVGLVLVFWQLRQTHFLTDMQLNVETTQQFRSMALTIIGEDFADVLARAHEAPDTLTTSDHLELDAYYLAIVNFYASEVWRAEQGLFDPEELDVALGAGRVFGTPYGRAWWRINRAEFGYPEAPFARELEAKIEATEGDATMRRIGALREALTDQ